MQYILNKTEFIQRWILVALSMLATGFLVVLCIQIFITFYNFVWDININNFSIDAVFSLLGTFLSALIVLELIENISAYLKDHILNVEVAVTTALIAVSRKIIIFESEKETYQKLIALGVAVIALSLGYYLLHKSHDEKRKTLLGTNSISKAMGKRRVSDR